MSYLRTKDMASAMSLHSSSAGIVDFLTKFTIVIGGDVITAVESTPTTLVN